MADKIPKTNFYVERGIHVENAMYLYFKVSSMNWQSNLILLLLGGGVPQRGEVVDKFISSKE